MKKLICLLSIVSLVSLVACDTDSSSNSVSQPSNPISTTDPDNPSSSTSEPDVPTTYPDELKDLHALLNASYESLQSSITSLSYTITAPSISDGETTDTTHYSFALNQRLEERYNENQELEESRYYAINNDLFYDVTADASGNISEASRKKLTDEAVSPNDIFYNQSIDRDSAKNSVSPDLLNTLYEFQALLFPENNEDLLTSSYELFETDGGYTVLANAYVSRTEATYNYWEITAELDDQFHLTYFLVYRYNSISSENWDTDENKPLDISSLSQTSLTLEDITYGELTEKSPLLENYDTGFISQINEANVQFGSLNDMGTGLGQVHTEPQIGDIVVVDQSSLDVLPTDAIDMDTLVITDSSNEEVIAFTNDDMSGRYFWTVLANGDTTLTIGNAADENLYTLDLTVEAVAEQSSYELFNLTDGGMTFTITANKNDIATASAAVTDENGGTVNGPFVLDEWGYISAGFNYTISNTQVVSMFSIQEDDNPDDYMVTIEVLAGSQEGMATITVGQFTTIYVIVQ